MGQAQVYTFLLKNKGKWFTSRDIVTQTGLSMGSVSKSLKRLRESEQIQFIENPERRETFWYRLHARRIPKRSFKEISRAILNVLGDGKSHPFSDLERQVKTNWQTIRTYCDNLKIFHAVTISKDNKVKITKAGLNILRKL